ncbi:hypothetical protein LJB71_12675 [Thermomonas sp. S9]|nr:hypothetical protein [Thermomonas sp. S9]
MEHTLAYDGFGRLAGHTAQGLTTTYTVNALEQRMGGCLNFCVRRFSESAFVPLSAARG